MINQKSLFEKIIASGRVSNPSNYVSLILDGKVRARGVTPEIVGELKVLGGYEESIEGDLCWIIPASGDMELGKLLAKLRDQGFIFADEPGGWPPAAVIRDLRDRGYFGGDFQAVTWFRPGKYRIYSR